MDIPWVWTYKHMSSLGDLAFTRIIVQLYDEDVLPFLTARLIEDNTIMPE